MQQEQTIGTKMSCTCAECQRACTMKPGWFLPGEVEKVAVFLGVSLEDLFKTHLAVDWFDGSIFTLSPAITNAPAGTEFPSDPRGVCVFFQEGRCAIHHVKPFECREALHGTDAGNRHEGVAKQWKEHQGAISDLLTRPPVAKAFTALDFFSMFIQEES